MDSIHDTQLNQLVKKVEHWNRQLIEEISLSGRSPERDTRLLDGLKLGGYLKNSRGGQ